MVTKLKKNQIVTNIGNSYYDKNQNLKFLPNLKTQIATKLKNSKCDKSQNIILWQNSNSNKTQKF